MPNPVINQKPRSNQNFQEYNLKNAWKIKKYLMTSVLSDLKTKSNSGANLKIVILP